MYTKQIIQIENVSVEIFKADLLIEFKNVITSLLNKNKEEEDTLLIRQETANLLKVSLVILWVWTRKDVVPIYRNGYKVRYKKNKVLAL